MTARTGMATLILQMRGLANLGSTDYTIGARSYWDDEYIQEVLDRHRVEIDRELLKAIPVVDSGGLLSFKEYRSKHHNFENTTGGTVIFIVEDSVGTNAGTAAWSADYARGIVTFSADQGGTAYFVTGRSYELYSAAAEIWRMKAAHFSEHYNFSTDNHDLQRGQIIDNCLKMAAEFEAKAPVQTVRMGRDDCR